MSDIITTSIAAGEENRERIRGLFRAYPGITCIEVAEILGIGRQTVSRHMGKIRAEWLADSGLKSPSRGRK